jgi:hypothetical protein
MREEDIDLDKIRNGEGYDVLLHWAGPKKYVIEEAPLAHILTYFREQYRQKTGVSTRSEVDGFTRR